MGSLGLSLPPLLPLLLPLLLLLLLLSPRESASTSTGVLSPFSGLAAGHVDSFTLVLGNSALLLLLLLPPRLLPLLPSLPPLLPLLLPPLLLPCHRATSLPLLLGEELALGADVRRDEPRAHASTWPPPLPTAAACAELTALALPEGGSTVKRTWRKKAEAAWKLGWGRGVCVWAADTVFALSGSRRYHRAAMTRASRLHASMAQLAVGLGTARHSRGHGDRGWGDSPPLLLPFPPRCSCVLGGPVSVCRGSHTKLTDCSHVHWK